MIRRKMPFGGGVRAIVAVTCLAATVPALGASFSFTPFNSSAAGNAWSNQDLDILAGGSIPSGSWVGYSVEVDWLNPFSVNSAQTQVIFSTTAVTSQNPLGSGGFKYTSAGNGAIHTPDNGSFGFTPVTGMRFRGGFNSTFAGGAGANLNLGFRNNNSGSTADWSNMRVTLYDNYDDALGVTDLGVLSPGTTTITAQYTRRDTVRWYKFSLGADMGLGDFLSIDTLGNSLVGGGQGDSDTQIFIFSPTTGQMFYENNDFKINGVTQRESLFLAGDQSSSPFPDASDFAFGSNLFTSEYYLAVAPKGIEEQFGQKFQLDQGIDLADPSVDLTGSYTINFNTNVAPTPGAAALLGLGGLFTARRRRGSPR